MPVTPPPFRIKKAFDTAVDSLKENGLAGLSQEVLFEKLQNYKKLLDNGLILQGMTTIKKRF
jgi:hypothetical protein